MVTKLVDDTNLLWIIKMKATAAVLQQDLKPCQNQGEMRINRSRSVQ